MDLQDVVLSTLVIGWFWILIWDSKTSKKIECDNIALKHNKELLINEKLASLISEMRKLISEIKVNNLTCAQKSLVFISF